jgi:single-strand DNA-binding protein
MLNQTVLVGRLVNDPELFETESGKKLTRITLAVPRTYKNVNGEYDTDFIGCKLWQGVAQSTSEYCKRGDLVGNKSKRYTDKVQIIIALFINDFKGIFFFIISDMIK